MISKTCRLTVEVNYDPTKTDPDGICDAMNVLIETALSTPGIIEDYGDPEIGNFYPEEDDVNPGDHLLVGGKS